MKPVTSRSLQAGTGLALVIAMAAFLTTAVSTQAVLVTNGSTTLFYDNFENVVVGSLPTASVGSWIFSDSPNAVVSNAVPPGAAQGTQYLVMPRIGGATTAAADFGSISSGSLQASFSLFIPVNAPNDLFSVLLSDVSTNVAAGYSGSKLWLTVLPATDNKVYYNNQSLNPVDTGITYQKGVWQEWQIDYTFVPGNDNDQWTISVDRTTSAPLHGGYNQFNESGSPALRYLNFYTGANNSEFFLDAVPEPSTISLLVVGLLGLLRIHGAKRG